MIKATQKRKLQEQQLNKAKKQLKKQKKERISIKNSLSNQEYRLFLNALKDQHNNIQVISTQDTIPYQQMFSDGICRVTSGCYSKTIAFDDINYHLAQNDDKQVIFEKWCEFINYFDNSVSVQFSFYNEFVDLEEFKSALYIPEQNDEFNNIRKEYSEMLMNQLEKGNNGLIKTKYITLSIESENVKMARSRLDKIEFDVINNFKSLGVSAYALNGYQRLKLLHNTLHVGTNNKFYMPPWKQLIDTGLRTKDFIAPNSFNFKGNDSFRLNNRIARVSCVQILAAELTDKMLSDFLDMDNHSIVNIHIEPIDQTAAIKQVKSTITDIDRMKIEEQKKAVRSGYDMDIIPSDLNTYGTDAKSLLEDLQSRNERMFLVTFLILHTAKSSQELEDITFQTSSIAQKYNCSLYNLSTRQEHGFCSSLPIGKNMIPIQRGLTTTSVAIFIPFTTRELFQRESQEAIYYGINALSKNMIVADRKLLKTPSGLVFGTPGSGKSFSSKREMVCVFLLTQDQIIICDPEGEYQPVVEQMKGQVIKVSPSSSYHINPLDINLNYNEEDDPLSLKSDFVLSMFELIAASKTGLEPIEKTIIDRCVRLIYQTYLQDPKPENLPILEDLYNCLLKQEEVEAKRMATALEIYVSGSLNVFNHHTNVNTSNRVICYDIKGLGKQLKKLGMLIIHDQTWNAVTINRAANRTTWYYLDEFHLLLKEEQTANYSVEIWKRFRKWGGIPTGMTQNVKDLLSSPEIENILDNSDFIYLLNQASGDRERLAKYLNISEHQLSFVTNSNEGEGLIIYNNIVIPFIDKFPKNTLLYKAMTTKPKEIHVNNS